MIISYITLHVGYFAMQVRNIPFVGSFLTYKYQKFQIAPLEVNNSEISLGLALGVHAIEVLLISA